MKLAQFQFLFVTVVVGVSSCCLSAVSGFSPVFTPSRAVTTEIQAQPGNNNHRDLESNDDSGRRKFLQTVPIVAAAALTSTYNPSAAFAKGDEDVELPTKEKVTTTFDAIRYELSDPKGGVTYMQQRIDAQDWEGLLEFTKGYDQELRKARMGKAKKLLQSKELKEQGTSYANAVTFDLIGMNRNSRKGQESVDGANKYLDELRQDVGKFLELESTIQTQ